MNMVEIKLKGLPMFHLFNWITEACGGEGGDGDVVVICENYKEVAEKFKQWIDWKPDYKYSKDDYVVFGAFLEESYTFTNDRSGNDQNYIYRFEIDGNQEIN